MVPARLKKLASFFAGMLLLCALATGAGESRFSEAVTVGLLRADGIVVPFARHETGHWTRIPALPVPAEVRADHRRWLLVQRARPLLLEAEAVVQFSGSDTWYETWGLRTDFRSQPGRHAQAEFPAVRVGAVLSRQVPAVPFERIEGVQANTVNLLRAEFERRETERLRADPRPAHPASAADRRARRIRVQSWYRASPETTEPLHYVVLRRDYPPVSRENLTYRPQSVFAAWVAGGAAQPRIISGDLQTDDGSEMQISTAEPFAAIRLDGRDYVLAEFGAYEGTERSVLDVSSGMRPVLPPSVGFPQ